MTKADISDAKARGTIIIIGGGEDRSPNGERIILKAIAERVKGGKLVIATVASHEPRGYFDEYQRAFHGLGVGELVELYVEDRCEAAGPDKFAILDDAAGVFFTGGDQLRITSQIGATGIEAKVKALFERGGLVAGTSAGASAMSDTMVVKGTSQETHRMGDLHMAPGLGLMRDVIIDQHFAERGRFGRILGAVAHNPRVLGIGIDEDTAAIVNGSEMRVLGDGAVYVVDGSGVSHSNVAEAKPDVTLSMHDVKVHVLAEGDGFDLAKRLPLPAAAK